MSRHDVSLVTHKYRCRHRDVSVAESYTGVNSILTELLVEAWEAKVGYVRVWGVKKKFR